MFTYYLCRWVRQPDANAKTTGGSEAVTLYNVGAVFYMAIASGCVATVTFAAEWYFFKRTRGEKPFATPLLQREKAYTT